jgi:phosphomannomutase
MLDEQEVLGRINKRIVVDIKCSDVVWRTIQGNGGTPLLERTGHAFMRRRMVSEQALLGLDACGHYFFQELNGGDDGLAAALFILDLLARKGQTLAAMRQSLPPIFSTGELRISTAQITFEAAAKALRRAFAQASIVEIDGLRFVMEDGVVLIRKSGTEPVISLRIEGFDEGKYQHILSQCFRFLPSVAAEMRRALQDASRA